MIITGIVHMPMWQTMPIWSIRMIWMCFICYSNIVRWAPNHFTSAWSCWAIRYALPLKTHKVIHLFGCIRPYWAFVMNQPLSLTNEVGVDNSHGEIVHRLRRNREANGFHRARSPSCGADFVANLEITGMNPLTSNSIERMIGCGDKRFTVNLQKVGRILTWQTTKKRARCEHRPQLIKGFVLDGHH